MAELGTLALMGHPNCDLVELDLHANERVYRCDDCGDEMRFDASWQPTPPETKAVWFQHATQAEKRQSRTGPAGSWKG